LVVVVVVVVVVARDGARLAAGELLLPLVVLSDQCWDCSGGWEWRVGMMVVVARRSTKETDKGG
jgi:hypothetical protein